MGLENTFSNQEHPHNDIEKPIMQQMVESYERLTDNPESAAYDLLWSRLDQNLPEDEKVQRMKKLTEEYRLYKQGKNWK